MAVGCLSGIVFWQLVGNISNYSLLPEIMRVILLYQYKKLTVSTL